MFENIPLAEWATKEYGSQSIVASIDIKKTANEYKVYSHNEKLIDMSMKEAIKHVSEIGAGDTY